MGRVEGKVAAQPASLPESGSGAVPAQPTSYQEGTNPVPQDMSRLVEDAITAGK